jgi:hypothetical protein
MSTPPFGPWLANLLDHVGGADCRACPLCAAAGVLRGEHPEVVERFGAFLATLRTVFEQGAPAPPEQSARVQRIDLD